MTAGSKTLLDFPASYAAAHRAQSPACVNRQADDLLDANAAWLPRQCVVDAALSVQHNVAQKAHEGERAVSRAERPAAHAWSLPYPSNSQQGWHIEEDAF